MSLQGLLTGECNDLYHRDANGKKNDGGGAVASGVTSLRHALPPEPLNVTCARVTSSFRISPCETE